MLRNWLRSLENFQLDKRYVNISHYKSPKKSTFISVNSLNIKRERVEQKSLNFCHKFISIFFHQQVWKKISKKENQQKLVMETVTWNRL